MPGRNILFAISLVGGICSVAGCYRESPVAEKKFTSMAFSAFTVDPYRFRVDLTDEMVTDSLITPEGQVSKTVFFNDYNQRIRVYNTSDQKLLIDTPYTLRVGRVNAFTIYQLEPGTTPFYLAPSPDEPAAAPGKGKLKLICNGEGLDDSIRVVVEIQTRSGMKPRDTAVLKKGDFSRYFVVDNSLDTKVYFYKYPGNSPTAFASRSFLSSEFNTDFTIFRLLYQGTTSLIGNKLY